MNHEMDLELAHYLVELGNAVAAVKSGKVWYGEFYVEEVKIAFDGESTRYSLVPNDHGSYDLSVGCG